MRIAFVAPGGLDRSGRVRVIPALLSLVSRLASRHEVDAFVPGTADSWELGGARVHALGAGRRSRYPGLFGALRRVRPDVVHALWLDAAAPAGLAARRLGVPCVASVGGGELVSMPELEFGGARTLRGRLRSAAALRLASRVTAGSRAALALLPARLDARLAPLGVERAVFDAPPERAAGPPFRLLFVASLNRVKDPGTLLRAFALVAREIDAVLDVVGEDTLSGETQALAHDLGVAPRVRFHGVLPHDALPAFYRGAHLHVVTSRFESQGVAIAEAAAASLPTVGTAVGVLPELAPEAALTVTPGDAGALASAVAALLRDEPRRLRIGAAAHEAAARFDGEEAARRFEAIYEELVRRA